MIKNTAAITTMSIVAMAIAVLLIKIWTASVKSVSDMLDKYTKNNCDVKHISRCGGTGTDEDRGNIFILLEERIPRRTTKGSAKIPFYCQSNVLIVMTTPV